jgi:hypothetical protein
MPGNYQATPCYVTLMKDALLSTGGAMFNNNTFHLNQNSGIKIPGPLNYVQWW